MTKALYGYALACAAALILVAGSAWAGSQDKTVNIDPEAQKIVKDLSKSSQRERTIRYKVYDTADELTETGEMIQYAHVRTVVLRRPDRLMMETRGDQANIALWYDGSLFTLLDRDKNVYVQMKALATIDETIDMVYDRYGISTPLADMLSGDIYKVLMEAAITCRYLGTGLVGEIPCHHIAATQKDIDWQAWIDQGDNPHLRKLVITYKHLDGNPQYTVMLAEAEVLTSVSPGTFVPQLPEGASAVEPLPREEDEKSRL
jgi:hypothetical protein